MDAVDHVVSAKSVKAVVPELVGVTFVSVLPPAVYPVPDVSFVVLYAVVDASRVAELVNNAILNVLPVVLVKSWVPVSSCCLKDVHIA